MTSYPLRLDDIWRLLLPIIGATKDNSYMLIDDEMLTVRFGFFETQVPLTQVVDVEHIRWPWYFGVGLRMATGAMIGLIGSTQEVVKVTLREPQTVRVPFKMQVESIAASVEGHQRFIDELQTRLSSLKSAPR